MAAAETDEAPCVIQSHRGRFFCHWNPTQLHNIRHQFSQRFFKNYTTLRIFICRNNK